LAIKTKVHLPIDGKYIYQYPEAQGVSSDASLLQAIAIERFPEADLSVLELGSGSGILAIMLALQKPSWHITGIDIQAPFVELARENAVLCDVVVEFRHQDLRVYEDRKYDLIVSNPPWMPVGSGMVSPNPMRLISRHEHSCTMADIFAVCKRCLKPGGAALLLYPITRISELRSLALQSSLDIIAELTFTELPKIVVIHLFQRG
jgi:tRNA1(Val) A37 N6-methylase TrmN6